MFFLYVDASAKAGGLGVWGFGQVYPLTALNLPLTHQWPV